MCNSTLVSDYSQNTSIECNCIYNFILIPLNKYEYLNYEVLN